MSKETSNPEIYGSTKSTKSEGAELNLPECSEFEEYLIPGEEDDNRGQSLATDKFLDDNQIAKELDNIKANGKGGFLFNDTMLALESLCAGNACVSVITGHYTSQSTELPISLRTKLTAYPDKRFFVFPYAIGEEHNIGIVLDNETKEMRVYDHLDSTRVKSVRDSLLNQLASELNLNMIDGFRQSPYYSQADDWECGVLAVLSIEDDIVRHSRNEARKANPEKYNPDFEKEAERILRAARSYVSPEEQRERALNTILDVWMKEFCNPKHPENRMPENWMIERFSAILPEIVADGGKREELIRYVRGMHGLMELDRYIEDFDGSKKRPNRRINFEGIFTNIDPSIYKAFGEVEQDYFEEHAPNWKEMTGNKDIAQLKDMAFAIFYELQFSIPQKVRNAEKSERELFQKLKEDLEAKRIEHIKPFTNSFPWLFAGMDVRSQKRILENYHSALNDIREAIEREQNEEEKRSVLKSFESFLNAAYNAKDYTTFEAIWNHCEHEKINISENAKRSFLKNAAEIGNAAIIELLIKTADGPEYVKKNGGYALKIAARYGQKEIIKLLIERGGGQPFVAEYGGEVLEEAVANNRKDVVELLIKTGGPAYVRENGAMLLATDKPEKMRQVNLELLIETGGADFIKTYGSQAMKVAACNGQLKILQLLIEKNGGQPFVAEYGGEVLEEAVANNRKDVVELLIKTGGPAYVRENGAMLLATDKPKKMRQVNLELLIETGGADFVKTYGRQVMKVAAYNGQLKILQLVIEKNGGQPFVAMHGGEALKEAASECFGNIVTLLINEGGEDFVQKYGGEALKEARCWNSNKKSIELLINKGGEDFVQKYGGEKLIEAIASGQNDIADLLIEKGGKKLLHQEHGGAALAKAAEGGNKSVVELIIKTGGGEEFVQKYGGNALIQASYELQNDIITLLLENGGSEFAKEYGGEAIIKASRSRSIKDKWQTITLLTTPIISSLKGQARLNAERHKPNNVADILFYILASDCNVTIKTALPILQSLYDAIPSSAQPQGERYRLNRDTESPNSHPLLRKENGDIGFTEKYPERTVMYAKETINSSKSRNFPE